MRSARTAIVVGIAFCAFADAQGNEEAQVNAGSLDAKQQRIVAISASVV